MLSPPSSLACTFSPFPLVLYSRDQLSPSAKSSPLPQPLGPGFMSESQRIRDGLDRNRGSSKTQGGVWSWADEDGGWGGLREARNFTGTFPCGKCKKKKIQAKVHSKGSLPTSHPHLFCCISPQLPPPQSSSSGRGSPGRLPFPELNASSTHFSLSPPQTFHEKYLPWVFSSQHSNLLKPLLSSSCVSF